MNLAERFLVKSDKSFRLAKRNPDDTAHVKDKTSAAEESLQLLDRLDHLQQILYAENKRSVLIVLQGMDASGKDGTIRHLAGGINPQGCRVTPFNEPTSNELDHDFLWRIHAEAPSRGTIGIFNRSHYEDVLIVRVHELVSKEVWQSRYDQINDFEKMLASNGTTVLKFFLHISKDEQKKRFEDRREDPEKNWKWSASDEAERRYWERYQDAYQEALSRCSQPHAPWFVIPANRKWFRNLAISQIVVDAMERMNLRYPKPANVAPIAAGKK